MKKFFLLSLLLLFFVNSFSQSYKTFPAANAYWRESTDAYQCPFCFDYQIEIIGDTIIGSNTYHKLKSSGVEYQVDFGTGYCTSNIQNHFSNYKGAFREDVLNKKIYFCEPSSSSEELLYDFNLNIGDTVPPSFLNSNGAIINTIENIDSVLLNGIYHKRYKIDNCAGMGSSYDLYFIEGVGSTYGLLQPTGCPFDRFSSLICMSVNSQTIFPSASTSCSLVSTNEQYNLDELPEIYPIPTKEVLNIDFKNQQIESTVAIYDNKGCLVYSNKIITNKNKINLNEFESGLYFITIRSEESCFSKKIIILK